MDYDVKVDGDTAVARGYQLITLRSPDGFSIARTSFRVFHFRRVDGHWLIYEAESIETGKPECQDLIPTESEW